MRFGRCIRLLMGVCLSVTCVVAQDFDFFYFVQQWPGSYCDTKKSCCYPATGKPTPDFGIHGLWPNYNDGSYPSNCDPGAPFDRTQDPIRSVRKLKLHNVTSGLAPPKPLVHDPPCLSDRPQPLLLLAPVSDLINSMQVSWPTLSCPSNDGIQFWTHEWVKHGTCSESVLNQHAYFTAALVLKQRVDLLRTLTNAGIRPDGSSYSLSSIKAAIKDGIGFDSLIECNVDEFGNSQLYQVYICVDGSALKLIDCPVLPKGRCSGEIEFPSFE